MPNKSTKIMSIILGITFTIAIAAGIMSFLVGGDDTVQQTSSPSYSTEASPF
jgi:flagellar basal body-associated protein FliL